jgi:trypsin
MIASVSAVGSAFEDVSMRSRCLSRAAAIVALASAIACSDSTAPVTPLAGTVASPIVNGTFDGNGHPAVGALLFDFANNGINGLDLVCSGSLIAPTVFLTARHCLTFAPAGSQFYVTFDSNLLDNNAVVPAIAASSYAVKQTVGFPPANDFADVGVVILPAGPTAGITPVQLPAANLLDALAAQGGLRNQSFQAVGYGVTASNTGPPAFAWDGRRKVALEPFMGLTPYQLGLQMNSHATGQGGDCFGDSGSPKFVRNTNTIVALTNWGDVVCRAISWNYRLDTPSVRSFLSAYVALP